MPDLTEKQSMSKQFVYFMLVYFLVFAVHEVAHLSLIAFLDTTEPISWTVLIFHGEFYTLFKLVPMNAVSLAFVCASGGFFSGVTTLCLAKKYYRLVFFRFLMILFTLWQFIYALEESSQLVTPLFFNGGKTSVFLAMFILLVWSIKNRKQLRVEWGVLS